MRSAILQSAFLWYTHASAFVLMSPTQEALSNGGYHTLGGQGPWADPDSFDLREVVTTWPAGRGLGLSLKSSYGLSSGITWAFAPDFCRKMLHLFPERKMALGTVATLTCDDLRIATQSAFDVWSSNHPHVRFRDVTDRCTSLQHPEQCSDVAEVVMSASTMRSKGDVAAYVKIDYSSYDARPILTNGVQPKAGIGPRRAELFVAADMCWYLDTTFCEMMHNAGSTVVGSLASGGLVLRVALMLVFVVCAACMLFLVLRAWTLSFSPSFGCAYRVGTTMALIPIVPFLVSLFGIVGSPICYQTVVSPCLDCYNYVSTMTHEAGHVLGFEHPDTLTAQNLMLDASVANVSCDDPLRHVLLRTRSADSDASLVTVMHSIALHRPRICLTEDDVDGLRALYPVCDPDEKAGASAVCVHPTNLSGYTRLIFGVSVPYILSSAFMLAFQAVLRSRQARNLQALRANARKLRLQSRFLRAAAASANAQRDRMAMQAETRQTPADVENSRHSRRVLSNLVGGFTNRYVRPSPQQRAHAVERARPAPPQLAQQLSASRPESSGVKLDAIVEEGDEQEMETETWDTPRTRRGVKERPPSTRLALRA